MPSRKSGSSDAQADSRRSSLRRLSSIASFQTLFARRRSNNATETSSSSNLSLSSTIANAPEPYQDFSSSSNTLHNDDTVPELPRMPQPAVPSRRSSYICLPDDPIGGMPRSRTFSNLPLPTRARKTTNVPTSKSHSRLPSSLLPSTRLPSPPTTNRKHSHSRLLSAETRVPPIKTRMKRSDTEPLLKANIEQANNHPRSTAFKENISLSPIRPLPALDMSQDHDMYGSTPALSHAARHSWRASNHSIGSFARNDFSSSPTTASGYAHHPAIRIAREHKSSPIYRSSRDRQATPGASRHEAFQRWSSQPVLTNNTNIRRRSQHGEVKQTRLMSARGPPTPPPPKTPLASSQTMIATSSGNPKRRSMNKSSSPHHVRQDSEQTPIPSSSNPPSQPNISRKSVLEIHTAEPQAYWSGRICALADRYRNEELIPHLTPSLASTPSKSETDKMHTPEASTARLRRAFEYLHSLCVTPEARQSLEAFQRVFAVVMKVPELGRPIVLSSAPSLEEGGGSSDGQIEAGGSMSEVRKVSFMDRLLGRQKRKSLVLS